MSQWLQEEIIKIEDKRKSSESLLQRIAKFAPGKPILQFASECIEKLHFSSEELLQFDKEMMAEPLVFIQNGRNFDSSIAITEHYMKAAFLYRKEIDYGIFRLSDIAMTCCESSKNPVILKPTGKIFDIILWNGKGERMGGLSMQKEEDFTTFNEAMEKYAPDIRLNVPMEEVEKIRRNS